MRKRSKRQIKPAVIPCMVVQYISPESQIIIFSALNAFEGGWAEPFHFDTLLDLRDMLLLGAKAKEETQTLEAARAFNLALANIRDSWDGKKFSFTNDELTALKMLVDISNDFWNRQSGNFYKQAYFTLKKWRKEQYEDKSQQAGTDQAGMVCV